MIAKGGSGRERSLAYVRCCPPRIKSTVASAATIHANWQPRLLAMEASEAVIDIDMHFQRRNADPRKANSLRRRMPGATINSC